MPTHDAESAGALSTGTGSTNFDSNGAEQTRRETGIDTSTQAMASRPSSSASISASSSENDGSAQYSSISTSQKMISATWGSLLTSLL
ncbi:hypothetical protein FQN49_003718, partial [Arthroderma sp. PD_2]